MVEFSADGEEKIAKSSHDGMLQKDGISLSCRDTIILEEGENMQTVVLSCRHPRGS